MVTVAEKRIHTTCTAFLYRVFEIAYVESVRLNAVVSGACNCFMSVKEGLNI